jgi:hypothetical protein
LGELVAFYSFFKTTEKKRELKATVPQLYEEFEDIKGVIRIH